MERNLNDNIVLVAGASGVLGSRLAEGLARRGARLVLAGRDRARLDSLAARIPGSATATFDLASDDVSWPVAAALEEFGRLDGVVNAAGVVGFGTLADMEPEAVETLVRVDLLGPLALMRSALPHLDGGFIVNVTGVVAEQPVAGLSVYSAAKAGLSAATRALSRELRRRRILVVDARPPHTETGLAQRPIAGNAPRLPEGLDPAHVAERILQAIENEEREVPAAAFATEPA